MIQIDTLTLDPQSIDFPIFKKQLSTYAKYFNKNIIIPTGGMGGEWRNIATNIGLNQSVSEWILFLEQDFFWKQRFMDTVLQAMKAYDVIGFWEANRLHPAFLLIKREWIAKTTKDFDPVPDKLDHFGSFSWELVNMGIKIGELEKLGLEMKIDWYHMQGLTHNYNLCRDNNHSSVFKKDEFLTYHKYARGLNPNLPDVESQLGSYDECKWLREFFI